MFVALLTQNALRMRHILLSSIASLASPDFPTLHDIPKKVTEHKMCVWIFSTTFI
jgi:hypothetical protein